MPDSKDLVDQFRDLPPDRQEVLAAHLMEVCPNPFPPFFYWKHRLVDFPSVVSTPNVCGGSARLIRTRIPIWLLQHMRSIGFNDARILDCYPTLTASDLAQAWGFAAAHKAEIDREIAENERY